METNLYEVGNPTILTAVAIPDLGSGERNSLALPPDAMVGSIGDLARTLADGTEVPEEFYFAAA